MQRRIINPWKWQDQYGFVQANEVTGVQRTLVCSGQASLDENGEPVHAGDIRAQIAKSLDNLETVLKAADFAMADVVRLNWYTTNVDGFLEAAEVLEKRLSASECRCTCTLLGVARLAFPEMLVEFEATAVA